MTLNKGKTDIVYSKVLHRFAISKVIFTITIFWSSLIESIFCISYIIDEFSCWLIQQDVAVYALSHRCRFGNCEFQVRKERSCQKCSMWYLKSNFLCCRVSSLSLLRRWSVSIPLPERAHVLLKSFLEIIGCYNYNMLWRQWMLHKYLKFSAYHQNCFGNWTDIAEYYTLFHYLILQ